MYLLCIWRHKGYENMAQSPQFCDLIKICLWGKEAKGMLAVAVIDKLAFHFLKVWNNSGDKWLLYSTKCQETSSWNQFGGKRDNFSFTKPVRILQRSWKTPSWRGWALLRFLTDLREQRTFPDRVFFSKLWRGESVSPQPHHQYLQRISEIKSPCFKPDPGVTPKS